MTDEQPSADPKIDEYPSDPAVLAAMSPQERIALYLNMIRKSLAMLVLLGLAFLVISLVEVIRS
jgi:hypothetical protein